MSIVVYHYNSGKRYLKIYSDSQRIERPRFKITMDASREQLPKVYLFKKDYDMIEELIRCRPTEETGGDLYGLWTSDDEPVLHVVTGQGRELPDSSSKSNDSVTAKRKELGSVLRSKGRLSLTGQWQFKRGPEQKEPAIIEAVDQQYLHQITNGKDFVVILVDHDDSTRQIRLSPYLLSRFSVKTKGKCETLPGESVFRKDEDIKEIVDALLKKNDPGTENERNPENLGFKPPTKEDVDDGKNEGSSDVEMEDVSFHREDVPGWQTENLALPRMRANFACSQRDFKIYLFEEDQKMMEDLVLHYPDIETGGDLFGLWTSEGDVVLHIVLGPGQGCKRTDVSFYQDIPYLQRNGELLTQNYMLCHIGEWHSHHQLRLSHPSHGDSSTVIRNYPGPDTCGFLLIIANILSLPRRQVTLSPYLYTANSRNSFDLKGTIVPLQRYRNAFKRDLVIQRSMEKGMETERDYRPGATYQHSYTSRRLTTGKVGNLDVDTSSYTPSFQAAGAQQKKRSSKR